MIDINNKDFLVDGEKIEYESSRRIYDISKMLVGISVLISIGLLIYLSLKINLPIFIMIVVSLALLIIGILYILLGIRSDGVFLTNYRLVLASKNALGLFNQRDYDYKHMNSIRVSSSWNINKKLLGFGLLLIIITIIEFQVDLLDLLYHGIIGLLGVLLLFSCFKGHKHLVIIVMSSGELVFVVGFSRNKYLEFSKMLIKLSRVPINSLFATNNKLVSRYNNHDYQPVGKNYDPIMKPSSRSEQEECIEGLEKDKWTFED